MVGACYFFFPPFRIVSTSVVRGFSRAFSTGMKRPDPESRPIFLIAPFDIKPPLKIAKVSKTVKLGQLEPRITEVVDGHIMLTRLEMLQHRALDDLLSIAVVLE